MPDRRPYFAKKLEQLMAEQNMSQYHLARMTGIGQSNLSKLVRGEVEPTWRAVQKIAIALDVPPTAFVDPGITAKPVERRPPGRPPRIPVKRRGSAGETQRGNH